MVGVVKGEFVLTIVPYETEFEVLLFSRLGRDGSQGVRVNGEKGVTARCS